MSINDKNYLKLRCVKSTSDYLMCVLKGARWTREGPFCIPNICEGGGRHWQIKTNPLFW